MDAFVLDLESSDPKPLNIRVDVYFFCVSQGKLTSVTPVEEKDLSSENFEDFTKFDDEMGIIVGLSYNDVLHGKGYVKKVSFSIPPGCTKLVKVYKITDKMGGRSAFRFRVYEISERETRLVYSDHFSMRGETKAQLKMLSAKIGVDYKQLEAIVSRLS